MSIRSIYRYLRCGIIVCLSVPALAQSGSFLELSAGGGWSTLTYSLKGAPSDWQTGQSGSYNLAFHVGYGYMFNTYFGLGIGADISRYGAATHLSGQMHWQDITDTDGEHCNHTATINHWKERQELYYIELPLTFYVTVPLSQMVSLSAEVGLKYAYPLIRKGIYDAEITHTGQYPMWNLTLSNVPNHGYYTANVSGESDWKAQHQATAFAKLGVLFNIRPQLALFTHVYANCGLFNAVSNNEKKDFGVRDKTLVAQQAHAFIPPAVSLLETDIPQGKFLPVSVGLEIGIRVLFPSSHHNSPCRCLVN